MIKNIFLTGALQIGKSTLISKVIKENGIKPSGYKTLPYYIGDENRKGFYFHSLVDTDSYMNDVPISVQYKKDSCIKVEDTFRELGVHTLNISINDTSRVILLDELGKIEKDVYEFTQAIHNVLDSKKLVVGVIKKCDAKWLQEIKQRKDVLLFDLDKMESEQVYRSLNNLFSEIRNK